MGGNLRLRHQTGKNEDEVAEKLRQEYREKQLNIDEIRENLRKRNPELAEEEIERIVAQEMETAEKETEHYVHDQLENMKKQDKTIMDNLVTVIQLSHELEQKIVETGRKIDATVDEKQRDELVATEQTLLQQLRQLSHQVDVETEKEVQHRLAQSEGKATEEQVRAELKNELDQVRTQHMAHKPHREVITETERVYMMPQKDALGRDNVVVAVEQEMIRTSLDDDEFEEEDDHFGQSVFTDAHNGHLGAQQDDAGFCGGPQDDDDDEEETEQLRNVNNFDGIADSILEHRLSEIQRERLQKEDFKAIPKPSRLTPDEARVWNKKINSAIKNSRRENAEAVRKF